MTIFEDLLGLLATASPRRMTAQKAEAATALGYTMTGVVLRNPDTGRVCIVDSGAVRWMEYDEMHRVMHSEGEAV